MAVQKHPEDLNEIEEIVLVACLNQIHYETHGEFGYSDEVHVENLSNRQVAGYLSQLVQKDYIVIYDEFNQMKITKKCQKEFVALTGMFEVAD